MTENSRTQIINHPIPQGATMTSVNPDIAPTQMPTPTAAPQISGRPATTSEVIKPLMVPAGKIVYQVAVHTADVPGAGTDQAVYLWVTGTLSSTGRLYLNNGQDNFERGHTDYFYFTLPDIGTPTSAMVSVFGAPGSLDPWTGSNWLLDTVTINGTTFSHPDGWITEPGNYPLT
jgi:hypothetical protein